MSSEFNIQKIHSELSILIVDDEENLLLALETILLTNGVQKIKTLSNPKELTKVIESEHYHIVLLDENMGSTHGSDLISSIICHSPATQVIMLTAENSVNLVVKCMQSGAADYLTKPVNETRLIAAIINAGKKVTMVDEFQRIKSYLTGKELEHPDDFNNILTESDNVINLFKYIESVSKTPLPILLLGETGAGKEVFAKSIHNSSKQKGDFVAFNAAGVDDHFFSDTLFGHIKGSFTNASKDRPGLLKKAKGGSIFIDEIGDLQATSQIKLLRLLQEKEYFPLGSDQAEFCDAKIICATNKNLEEEVKAGNFREDLYYRLNSHTIKIPPLRDRLQDLEILVSHFINKHQINKNKNVLFPKQLIPILSHYKFPGNVRELEMMVADAVAMVKGNTISLEPFLSKIEIIKNSNKKELTSSEDNQSIEDFPSLKEIEKSHIQKAMKIAENNQSLASRLLGITRQTLNKKLK
ncbi:MAG: two-component system response regulator [Planctomycetota bacterium]|nr:MAG: two-component system response regulator [Planctomycetota bacterium]